MIVKDFISGIGLPSKVLTVDLMEALGSVDSRKEGMRNGYVAGRV